MCVQRVVTVVVCEVEGGYYLQHRPNVLLLGDSQGDPSMTDGINGVNSHSIIKIGFLNHDVC